MVSKEKNVGNAPAVGLPVINLQGKEVGSVELDASVFAVKLNEPLVHEAVVSQLAKKRAGTHSALTKAEVSGGGKKPWKQKGTGNARAGSNTSPLWVGGGVSHGPKPRDYTTRLPKRTRRQAVCTVLTDKVKQGQLKILESLELSSGKTKDLIKVLTGLKVLGQKVVILLKASEATATDSKKVATKKAGTKTAVKKGKAKQEVDSNTLVQRAAGNIPGLTILNSKSVNVYELLRHKVIIGTKDSITELQTRLMEDK